MSDVLEAVHSSLSHQAELTRLAGEKAAILSRERAKRQVARKLADLTTDMRRHQRISAAVRGVRALSELGRTKEIQSLIAATGGWLTIWSLSPRFKGCRAEMGLTSDAVMLLDEVCYTQDEPPDPQDLSVIRLPYLGDALIYRKALERISVLWEGDVEEDTKYYEIHRGNGGPQETEIFFELLVDCADPEKLSKYFINAVKRSY